MASAPQNDSPPAPDPLRPTPTVPTQLSPLPSNHSILLAPDPADLPPLTHITPPHNLHQHPPSHPPSHPPQAEEVSSLLPNPRPHHFALLANRQEQPEHHRSGLSLLNRTTSSSSGPAQGSFHRSSKMLNLSPRRHAKMKEFLSQSNSLPQLLTKHLSSRNVNLPEQGREIAQEARVSPPRPPLSRQSSALHVPQGTLTVLSPPTPDKRLSPRHHRGAYWAPLLRRTKLLADVAALVKHVSQEKEGGGAQMHGKGSAKSLFPSQGSQKKLSKPSLRDLSERVKADAKNVSEEVQNSQPAKRGNMARVAMKVFAAVALGRKKKDEDVATDGKDEAEDYKLPKWDYLLNHRQSKLRKKVSKAIHKAAAISAVGKSNLGAGTAEFQIIKSLQSTQNEQRVAMLASILQRFKFFHLFSESQVQELAGVAVLTTMAEGDFLFKQDEIPDAVYVMLSGRCNLTKGESQKVSSVATEGDAVGDINHLDDRRRRNFTAQIVSNVAEVVVLRGEDLDKLYRKWQRQEERDLIQVLAEVPGFSSISHTNLQKLVFFFEKKKYSEGEIIYRQQDESQFFFVVCEGSVEVIKTVTLQRSSKVKKPHTHVKKNLEITTLSRSEFFGELEIFNDLPRTCTLIAKTESQLLRLKRIDFVENLPNLVLESIWKIASLRVQWHNKRVGLILESLSSLGFKVDLETKTKILLEQEPRPILRMKATSMLPGLSGGGGEAWLGPYTSKEAAKTKEWAMYSSAHFAHKVGSTREVEEKEEEIQQANLASYFLRPFVAI